MRRLFVFLILIINIIVTVSVYGRSSHLDEKKSSYFTTNYYAVSVFNDFKGFLEWKNDFLHYYKQRYKKVTLKNFDHLIYKLKHKINNEILSYKRDPQEAKYYDSVLIPVILIKEENQKYNHFQIYYNGILLSPTQIEIVGEINIYFYNQPTNSKQSLTTLKTYNLVLYTFSDFISHQKVIVSVKNEPNKSHIFYVENRILQKDFFSK